MSDVRVQKIISNNTSYSRRKAEELIEQGRVKVNGELIKIGSCANPEKDKIELDGKEIKIVKKIYLAMNKPVDFVTSTKDPHEKTIMKLLPPHFKDKVYPVGRLDKDSEGLLILTNDGDLANEIMHPSNNIKKTYEGICNGKLSKNDIEALRKGVKLEEGVAKCEIRITPDKEITIFEIILETGWNRQIRRMFDAIGHEVIRLKRTKIGNFELKELQNKELKEYKKEELIKKMRG